MQMLEEISNRTFLDGRNTTIQASNRRIREDNGHRVDSFLGLLNKVAVLQFLHPNYILMYRGQSKDYRDSKGLSTVHSSILRPARGDERPSDAELTRRHGELEKAGKLLCARMRSLKLLGTKKSIRHETSRWAILQHYEVCATPVLDVSQSLRVAASFAALGARDEAFVLVFALPYLSGGVTVDAESGLLAIRLASACPPMAARPHTQEGYIIGNYPVIRPDDDHDTKYESLDFARRLIGKFRFNPKKFESDAEGFPLLTKDALYPETDKMARIARQIQDEL